MSFVGAGKRHSWFQANDSSIHETDLPEIGPGTRDDHASRLSGLGRFVAEGRLRSGRAFRWVRPDSGGGGAVALAGGFDDGSRVDPLVDMERDGRNLKAGVLGPAHPDEVRAHWYVFILPGSRSVSGVTKPTGGLLARFLFLWSYCSMGRRFAGFVMPRNLALREIRGRVASLTPPKPTLWQRMKQLIGFGLDVPMPSCRELRRFVELAEVLEARLRREHCGQIPVAELHAEFWRVRITRMALIEVLATGRLSVSSFETLAVMPALVRERTLRAVSAARQVQDDREAMALIDQTALCLPK